MTEYRIPTTVGCVTQIEKRSRFIGHVWPITTLEEAEAHLKTLRAEHRDAAHNVYAYLLRDGNQMRCSDDGEPQGTAGGPVLNVFAKEAVTNVLCTVTRYFGGTLLGSGGLVRAYGQTAKLALDAAGISIVRQWQRLQLNCNYARYERLAKTIAAQGAVTERTDFGADVTLTLLIPVQESVAFCAHMTEVSAGTVRLKQLDIQEIAVPL